MTEKKSNHYWAAQEERWYKQWEEAQQQIDHLESIIMRLEDIALIHIEDEQVRDEVKKIAQTVWRGQSK